MGQKYYPGYPTEKQKTDKLIADMRAKAEAKKAAMTPEELELYELRIDKKQTCYSYTPTQKQLKYASNIKTKFKNSFETLETFLESQKAIQNYIPKNTKEEVVQKVFLEFCDNFLEDKPSEIYTPLWWIDKQDSLKKYKNILLRFKEVIE